jgi:hypothetical protein
MSSGYDDRFADEYDDRDRPDDRDGPDERDDRRVIEKARAKVATPALLLMLSGLVGLLLEVGALGLAIAAPTVVYDFMVNMVKNQPQGPERDRQLKDMEAQKQGMMLNSPMNFGSIAVGMVLNLLTVVGGIKMRSLSGFGLAMTGSITGIVPMGGCCCLTLPFGIWALVVLVNPDVKAGFEANRRAASGY